LALQNYSLLWIEKAAKEATRMKRIAMTVEVTLRAREKRDDRVAAKRRRRGQS
jgi:hypothetical protein